MANDNRQESPRIVSAQRKIAAPAAVVFELIADPSRQPEWDGNDNLAEAAPGQRVRAVGDVFSMLITKGTRRDNTVVEFREGELIAWRPSEPGQPAPGHLWRWEVVGLEDGTCAVTHTYDWTELKDGPRIERARATTAEWLGKSLDRLAALAEK